MMRKRGFTLVELLCVLIIISIISIITVPLVMSYVNSTKEGLYNDQVSSIKKAAEKWAIKNTDKIDKNHINDTFITLESLQYLNYLEKDEILNPKDKTRMNGCIVIKYNMSDKKYDYDYIERECSSITDESDSYVIYSYNTETSKLDSDTTNTHQPFYLDILSNNLLKVSGETTDGLYDLDNEYVFAGTNVNNYVEYEGKNWRVLSIDKKDYSMKLISVSGNASLWSDETETDFAKATSQQTLSTNVNEYGKLLESWNNGEIANQQNSIDGLRSDLLSKNINSKAGLISVYDYVLASTSPSCNSNFLSSDCKNNNYLFNLFSANNDYVWTMNTDGSSIWYIDATGSLGLSLSDASTYDLYTVIKLPINVYNTSDTATGSSSTFSYKLK